MAVVFNNQVLGLLKNGNSHLSWVNLRQPWHTAVTNSPLLISLSREPGAAFSRLAGFFSKCQLYRKPDLEEPGSSLRTPPRSLVNWVYNPKPSFRGSEKAEKPWAGSHPYPAHSTWILIFAVLLDPNCGSDSLCLSVPKPTSLPLTFRTLVVKGRKKKVFLNYLNWLALFIIDSLSNQVSISEAFIKGYLGQRKRIWPSSRPVEKSKHNINFKIHQETLRRNT